MNKERKDLENWIKDNHLSVEFLADNIIEVKEFGKMVVVSEKEQTLDERFVLNLTDQEIALLDTDIDYLLFKFGDFWFYHHKDKDTELNFFRYVGKANANSLGVPFLGIHGEYELCNGSRSYKDWVKKIKFLGYTAAGICEHQTLAGNSYFQDACKKAGIKAIHGRTNKIKSKNGSFYYVKSYVKNEQGWKNLLKIHNTEIIARHGDGNYVTEEEYKDWSNGLVTIICHDTDLDNITVEVFDKESTFFQFNPIEYVSNSKDEQHLKNLKKYLYNYVDIIQPLLLQDCYYLDKGDSIAKSFLNKVGGGAKQFRSDDEYVKDFSEFCFELYGLASFPELAEIVIASSLQNYQYILKECDYSIGAVGKYLPKYKMNPDEALLYKDNEDMFFSLIQKGFAERIQGKVEDENVYWERLEKEIAVLQEGGVVDYFLILYDVFNYIFKHKGVRALGRGSSAGSAVAFVLGITQVDPIKYGLLFERFLSKARLLSGSLPDIDSDIPSGFRQEVIEYVINKYGRQNVTFIGTAQAFKLKSGVKDYLRDKGFSMMDLNLLTSFISEEDNKYGVQKLFEVANDEKLLKKVIREHPEMIYILHLILGQPRSFGMHAAGIVIFPEYDNEGNPTTALDYAPLRYSGDSLVTELEKAAVENEGFLKADLLGLKQLDKIVRMNELIESNNKEVPLFEDVDFEDQKVFELFRNATTEDVFQFNTDVQKSYLLNLQPEKIDDLIAANALNRPGTMEINAHMDYVKIKNGEKEEDRLPLIEDILEPTRSLIAYQEQVMNIYQRITDCDLVETDKFRRTISTLASKGTKEERLIAIGDYKDLFMKGYKEKGVSEEDANRVWDKMEAFASYSFNKSHSACYAMTGFWAAYYKTYYPLEFYTSSLEAGSQDSNKETTPRLISEIYSSNLIKLYPPDINKSSWQYVSDVETNAIYWSLISVKQAGEKAVETLLEERSQNGQYFSFEEFVERAKNTKVNRRVIVNFILSGCFDALEGIEEERDRLQLLKQYGEMLKVDLISEHIDNPLHTKNFYWVLLQKQICGLGVINYAQMYKEMRKTAPGFITIPFSDSYLLQEESQVGKHVAIGGILIEARERATRKGAMCQLVLNSNDETCYITIWPDQYTILKSQIIEAVKKPIFVNGTVEYDTYKKINILKSTNFTQLILLQ